MDSVELMYREITLKLIKLGLTVSTMESCTSGLIASLITDTEGSSAVMKGSFITYCNEAKVYCGVDEKIIEKYTVYSRETAEAMAKAARGHYKADIGIGITGTFGNIDVNNPQNSYPGVVYYALDFKGIVKSFRMELGVCDNRLGYKLAASEMVAASLVKELEEYESCNA